MKSPRPASKDSRSDASSNHSKKMIKIDADEFKYEYGSTEDR